MEKDEQIWACEVIAPVAATLRLYDTVDVEQVVDEALSKSRWSVSQPLLAALAFGVVIGGSIAAFRRPQLQELPQESSGEE